jgi:hypothetical protein
VAPAHYCMRATLPHNADTAVMLTRTTVACSPWPDPHALCCCCCCCQSLDPAKYPLPEPYPYKEAAAFFAEPDVTPAEQLPPLKWSAPDEEALIAFLVGEWEPLHVHTLCASAAVVVVSCRQTVTGRDAATRSALKCAT